jgi:hypothetical protein
MIAKRIKLGKEKKIRISFSAMLCFYTASYISAHIDESSGCKGIIMLENVSTSIRYDSGLEMFSDYAVMLGSCQGVLRWSKAKLPV